MMNESLVEYLYEPGGALPHKCGYCKSPNTSYTQGVWAYEMSCQNYQYLVDRGFQRSGKFVYRPNMKKTCCPQYVIRMDVTKFQLSKSQKTALKKFKQYLIHGRTAQESEPMTIGTPAASDTVNHDSAEKNQEESTDSATPVVDSDIEPPPSGDTATVEVESEQQSNTLHAEMECSPSSDATTDATKVEVTKKKKKPKKIVQPGLGPDPSKPPCKKAKIIRMERKAQKLLERQKKMAIQTIPGTKVGETDQKSEPPSNCDAGGTSEAKKPLEESDSPPPILQSLDEFLKLPKEEDCVHKFETRMVRISTMADNFMDSYDESYIVFKKFQTIIHKEKEEDSGERQFEEFLVNSPLSYEEGSGGMPYDYGTYHQQYILDGKIFAVGVLDILPRGVLCEYLYYDPEYRFLAPGVLTAILEIALGQEFYRHNPHMQYYYMGFYVQSCPKMNYKSKYSSSYLLCPETYQYVSLQNCIPKLKQSGYSRLADEDVADAQEGCNELQLDNVPTFADMTPMPFSTFKTLNDDSSTPLVQEYVQLVGLEVAMKMKLFLGRRAFM